MSDIGKSNTGQTDIGRIQRLQSQNGKDASTQSAVEIYLKIINDNIEYERLTTDKTIDRDRLDEIVEIMLETICTARKTIRIAGDDYPAELVKAKFMKLDSSHI